MYHNMLFLRRRGSIRKAKDRDPKKEQRLVANICQLVSSKGTDVLLKSGSEVVPKDHRFRQSLPPNLWRRQVVCGWHWPISHTDLSTLTSWEPFTPV